MPALHGSASPHPRLISWHLGTPEIWSLHRFLVLEEGDPLAIISRLALILLPLRGTVTGPRVRGVKKAPTETGTRLWADTPPLASDHLSKNMKHVFRHGALRSAGQGPTWKTYKGNPGTTIPAQSFQAGAQEGDPDRAQGSSGLKGCSEVRGEWKGLRDKKAEYRGAAGGCRDLQGLSFQSFAE